MQIGQHVVCIALDDSFPEGVIPLEEMTIPTVGTVYTIERISTGELKRETCLVLAEIGEQRLQFLLHGELHEGDVIFPARHFRPLTKLRVEDFTTVTQPTELV
jgi:hypothetical protein